jgi:hypothetical protein
MDQKTGYAPHDCPECGSPSYIPFGLPAECTNRECVFYNQDCWVKHVMELPDDEEGVEVDIEDEPTQPKGLSLTDYLQAYTYPPAQPSVLPPPPLTPGQKKAMKILDDAIDKVPVPFYLTPDDKNATLEVPCEKNDVDKQAGLSQGTMTKGEAVSGTRSESLLEYSLRMRLESARRTRG